MFKKTVIILVSAAALADLNACAKKRPVERIKNLEGNRLPKASFDDGRQWLGRVTIVNNGSNNAFGFIGSQSDVQYGSFRFTKDHLQYVTQDEGSKEVRVLNQWAVIHSDYHQKVSGGRVSNQESENDEIVWKQKKYFFIDWSTANVSEQASFPFDVDSQCWNKTGVNLLDDSQEVDADHISFTLSVSYEINEQCLDDKSYSQDLKTHTVAYKYSFMPDPASNYKPYVYTGENDPLMRKFGYFNTVSPYINSEGRSANTFYMERWKPGKHTIYFAPGFPEKYRWVYADPQIGVIARTNKLFADAKIDLQFEIKPSDGTQKFGDIRYSFVNIIEDIDAQAPLGYGPATAHPRSGEILSANSTLWVSDLKYYLDRIRDQKALEANRESSTLRASMKRLLQQDDKTWDATSAFVKNAPEAALFRSLLPSYTYASSGNGFANRNAMDDSFNADKRLAKYREGKVQNTPDITAALAGQALTVDALKKEMLRDNLTLQRRSTVWNLTDEMFDGLKDMTIEDSQKILDDIIYRVAIHEFGHNLNLRHNFYGSVDAGTRKSGLATTSVMDYLDLKDEIGAARDWEDYDRAALLYAYSDGRIDRVKESGDPYLYCTDEHLRSNPLCNQFDKGSTPTEILVNMINQYDDGYWMRNFRYGRDFWSTGPYRGNIFGTMWKVKKFFSFQNNAFQRGEMEKLLLNRKDLTPALKDQFSKSIQDDMDQSVRLALAFYGAVIQQKDGDRPFADSFDKSSGALTRIGIVDDKLFAMRFLMGDDAFALDPNRGALVLSFAQLLKSDSSLKDLATRVLADVYVNPVDMYAGFDDIGREYFIASAAGMADRANSPTEFARITCYQKSSFLRAFNLKTDFASTAGVLDLKSSPSTDAYFQGETAIAFQTINGYYYVAGAVKNPFAAELVNSRNASAILNSHMAFSSIAEGRSPTCR